MGKELKILQNYGVLTGPPPVGTYIYGNELVASNITIDPLEWESYFSKGEIQRRLFDTMACVTFSALNINEVIFNYHIRNGMFSKENVEWLRTNGYIDSNGEVNFSDRFTAKMSETMKTGNWLYKVADSIRNHGVVPEADWAFDGTFNWDQYYAEIPQEIKNKGLEFKKRFEVSYEIVLRENMKEALTHAPLQITAHAWPTKVDGVYQKSNNQINHAISMLKPEWFIYDHYELDSSFVKQLAPDYIFGTDVYKFNVSQKEVKNMIRTLKKKDDNRIFAVAEDSFQLFEIGAFQSYKQMLDNKWVTPFEEVESLDAFSIVDGPLGFIK